MQLQSFTARMPLMSLLMTTSAFGLGSGADAGVLLNGVIYTVSVLYYKADTSQVITNKLLQYWQQKAASLLPPTK